jgi:hypothetical protein
VWPILKSIQGSGVGNGKNKKYHQDEFVLEMEIAHFSETPANKTVTVRYRNARTEESVSEKNTHRKESSIHSR